MAEKVIMSDNVYIAQLIVSKLNDLTFYKNEMLSALQSLLNINCIKYNFDECLFNNYATLSNDSFQNILAHLNEKNSTRKDNGVYYTPNDVTQYIICNSYINKYIKNNEKIYSYNSGLNLLKTLNKSNLNNLLFKSTAIDPTCGAGEFLISLFDIKYSLLREDEKTDENILKICSTIYANDINPESLDISKARLFFSVGEKLKNKDSFKKLSKIFNENFYNVDFISNFYQINKTFDFVLGNPPYIEYGKYEKKDTLVNNFGNVYADVLKNSVEILNKDGVLGYIIPLSYISTTRMSKLRQYIQENMKNQFILSFADRPDCLFDGVHQKLNIIISKKGLIGHKIYTSNYRHWYNEERSSLFENREVIECQNISNQFIPKIGNFTEKNIFSKIITDDNNNIYDIQDKVNGKALYLNTRACFWIKAFSFNPGSKEYKDFYYTEPKYYFIESLLNSSLFWLYWTIVSDCWHITTKELTGFYVPNISNDDIEFFKNITKKLETKLEKTKKYVGTVQVDYEYKHKFCKDVIDEIDNKLAEIYNFDNVELQYIKDFAKKYRTGEKND